MNFMSGTSENIAFQQEDFVCDAVWGADYSFCLESIFLTNYL